MDLRPFGTVLVAVGVVCLILGAVFILNPGVLSWFGHLPGDITVQKKNFSFYFPVTTCLVGSAILSLILWLISKK